MRRETLIAVAVALVLGITAVYLANSYLLASERKQDAAELTRVAVATVPIEYGTELTPDKIRFASYPRSSLPPGSFQSAAQLFPKGEKRVALLAMGPNEPILAGKISGAGTNASIAALLPDGMRAASVRINDVSGVAGFVQPNDSVDVLITRQFANAGGNSQQITDVLLQDVRVMAIGQNAKGAEGRPISAKNATLQVDPLGAQKLALAQEIGSLSLVLRKPGQTEDTPYVETVSLDDLRFNRFSGPRPVVTTASAPAAPRPVVRQQVRRPAAPVAPRPVAAKPKVEVVRGTSGSEYEVGGNG
jgi:pilus assembly protein CpaB